MRGFGFGSARQTRRRRGVVPVASPVDLLVIAGQSNAGSYGTAGNTSDVPGYLSGPMSDVFIWNPNTGAWMTYQAGVTSACYLASGDPGFGSQIWGMEAQLAWRFRQDNPAKPLYIVKESYSSTALDPVARASGRLVWKETLAGELYDRLVSRVNAAKAALAAAGKTPAIRAFCWMQGETDATNSTTASNYGANLASFITAARASCIGASTPVVLARCRADTGFTFNAAVRSAEVNYAETTANTRWVDEDGIALAADNVHFNPAGCVTFGNRFYDAVATGAEIAGQYVARMTAAPPAGRTEALATLFQALVDKSVYGTLLDLKLLASHDQQSALLNVKNDSFAGTLTNMTFVTDRGINGSGSGSFLNTGLTPSTADPTLMTGRNFSASFYLPGSTQDASAIDYGALTGGTIVCIVRNPSDNTSFRITTASSDPANTLATPDAKGLWTFQRSASASQQAYRNGALAKTDTVTTGGGLPTVPTYLGGRNGGSGATTRRYAMLAQGSARTAAQEAGLYAAVNAYLTAIGAG